MEQRVAAHGPETEPVLLRRDDGPVTTLTLNRPGRGNALSTDMIAALTAAFEEIAGDRGSHVIVLEGAGGRIFSAGHDLREFSGGGDADFFRDVSVDCSAMMQAILALPQPVIAKVRGVATAAGCQLVAACDLAWAARSARFATPGVNIGLWCLTPMVALSRAVHRKHAMEMLLRGRLHGADEAFRIGLVNAVVPDEALDEAVAEVAADIASKSTYSVSLGKRAFYQQLEMDLPQAYAFTSELVGRNMMHADAKEGIGAFLDKRQPKWVGRR